MFRMSSAIHDLQAQLPQDALGFLPELILCGTIVLLLFLRLFTSLNRWHLGWVALLFTLTALGASVVQWQAKPQSTLFTGLLAYDTFTVFLRLFLLSFVILVIWLTMLTGIPDREDSGDFYCLLL